MLTVGQVAENCFIVRRDGSDRGLIIDPGEEAERILQVVDELGIGIDAILVTHTHFDHIGAVAPVARATGAPVYCPELEVAVLPGTKTAIVELCLALAERGSTVVLPDPGYPDYPSGVAMRTFNSASVISLGLLCPVFILAGGQGDAITCATPPRSITTTAAHA